jgi:hypothetical protein
MFSIPDRLDALLGELRRRAKPNRLEGFEDP